MDQKMKLFSKATLDYLFENRMNDSKAWFEEHKSTYQTEVFAPLHDLVEALSLIHIYLRFLRRNQSGGHFSAKML